jgi:hypothetical protein
METSRTVLPRDSSPALRLMMIRAPGKPLPRPVFDVYDGLLWVSNRRLGFSAGWQFIADYGSRSKRMQKPSE